MYAVSISARKSRGIICTWMRPCAHDSYSTSRRIGPLCWRGVSRKLRSIVKIVKDRGYCQVYCQDRWCIVTSLRARLELIRSAAWARARARTHCVRRFIDRSIKGSTSVCLTKTSPSRFLMQSHKRDDAAPASFTSDLYTSKCNHYSLDRGLYVRRRCLNAPTIDGSLSSSASYHAQTKTPRDYATVRHEFYIVTQSFTRGELHSK